jgi:Cytochrome c oxidase subunit IV
MTEPEPGSHADVHDAIHLPPPSIWPALLALGIAFLLTGLVVNLILLIVGVVISVVATALWVRDARHEFASLPD